MIGDRKDLNSSPDRGLGGSILAGFAVIAVLALVWMWAPWSGPRTAENTSAGTTVGSTTNRQAAPPAAAPSATR